MLDDPKNISLLLPTRGRPSLVYRLFDSILETTSNPDCLEIVLYIDDDDTESHKITHNALPIVKLVRPHDTMGNTNRACYSASSGRYVMLLNDDVVFRTRNWDVAVMEAFTQTADDIALVYGNDQIMGKGLSSLPIVSRTVCELMGGICPQEYKRDFIDTHILDTFKRLSCLGYERIIYLQDIVFDHMHYFGGMAELDNTYLRNRGGTVDDMLFISLCEERQQSAVRMARYIEAYKNHRTGLNADSLAQGPHQNLTKRDIFKPATVSNNPIARAFTTMQVIKEAYSKIFADRRLPFTWRLKQFAWIVSRQAFIFNTPLPLVWRVKLFVWTILQKVLGSKERAN